MKDLRHRFYADVAAIIKTYLSAKKKELGHET